jgi:hypothetical protein
MIAFAAVMVGAMWLYWELYTRPYRPLQIALAGAFPGSSPRVVGGKHKSHLPGAPRTLRVVLTVPLDDFDPTQDVALSEIRALAAARLTAEHQDLAQYDRLEIHLIQRPPEQTERHWSSAREVEEWRKLLAAPP